MVIITSPVALPVSLSIVLYPSFSASVKVILLISSFVSSSSSIGADELIESEEEEDREDDDESVVATPGGNMCSSLRSTSVDGSRGRGLRDRASGPAVSDPFL